MKPKWKELALGETGVREGRGAANNERVLEYYRVAGHEWVKKDSVAWCSAFMNWVMISAGYGGTRSLAARSWLKYGKKLRKPTPWCIMIFERGNSSWQGHVTFWTGRENATHYECFGGNQKDSVCTSWYPKSKLLGCRVPQTATRSRTSMGLFGTGGGTAMVQVADVVQETGGQFEAFSGPLATIGTVLVVAGIGLALYAKLSDIRSANHEDLSGEY